MPRPPLPDAYHVKDSDLLRQLMVSQRWSYNLLAAEVGCSQSMLHYIVTGQRRCSRATATAIAERLGVPLGLIFVPGLSTTVDNSGVPAGRTEGGG